jgi:hypothetical protein
MAFFISLGIGQLVYGPVSDMVGLFAANPLTRSGSGRWTAAPAVHVDGKRADGRKQAEDQRGAELIRFHAVGRSSSIVGWQFVARIAAARNAAFGGRLAQQRHLADQQVDLSLLPDDDLIESVEQVFGKAGLDFQLGQALFGKGVLWHAGIGHDAAHGRQDEA